MLTHAKENTNSIYQRDISHDQAYTPAPLDMLRFDGGTVFTYTHSDKQLYNSAFSWTNHALYRQLSFIINYTTLNCYIISGKLLRTKSYKCCNCYDKVIELDNKLKR